MKNKYKWVVIEFMVFFIFEYTSPIINSLMIGQQMGWTWQETLRHQQVLKHVLRLPIYGIMYLWIFSRIPKGSKAAIWLWRISAWLHIVFKPTATLFVLYTANKFGILGGFPAMSILFLTTIVMVYGTSIFIIEKYWKEISKKTET